jgi:hypothetical protein
MLYRWQPPSTQKKKRHSEKKRFFVNIRDTLDYPVVKEKVPVKCLPSSQKFVSSEVLCDLILCESVSTMIFGASYFINSFGGVK